MGRSSVRHRHAPRFAAQGECVETIDPRTLEMLLLCWAPQIDNGQHSSHCDAVKEERLIVAMQTGGMHPDLTTIKAALANISDTELAALIAATYGVPQTAPGLLAWIDGACDWELNRRRGFDYPLLLLR